MTNAAKIVAASVSAIACSDCAPWYKLTFTMVDDNGNATSRIAMEARREHAVDACENFSYDLDDECGVKPSIEIDGEAYTPRERMTVPYTR